MSITKLVKLIDVLFFSVITLKGLNFGLKLIFNVCPKIEKFAKDIRFISNRIHPSKMSKLIKKDNIIFQTTITY